MNKEMLWKDLRRTVANLVEERNFYLLLVPCGALSVRVFLT